MRRLLVHALARLERRPMWKARKGEPNRRTFFKLLQDGRAQGTLAFSGTGRPAGALSRAAPPGTWRSRG
jgi:hypothetical protein